MTNDTEFTSRVEQSRQDFVAKLDKALLRGKSWKDGIDWGIYVMLGMALLFSVRAAVVLTVPLVALSVFGELAYRHLANDRQRALYGKPIRLHSWIMPIVWHVWLVVLLLGVLWRTA